MKSIFFSTECAGRAQNPFVPLAKYGIFLLFLACIPFTSKACVIGGVHSFQAQPENWNNCQDDFLFTATAGSFWDFHRLEVELQRYDATSTSWIMVDSYMTDRADIDGTHTGGGCYDFPLSFTEPTFQGMAGDWRIRVRAYGPDGSGGYEPVGSWLESSSQAIDGHAPTVLHGMYINDPGDEHEPYVANNCEVDDFELFVDADFDDFIGDIEVQFTVYESNSDGDKLSVLNQSASTSISWNFSTNNFWNFWSNVAQDMFSDALENENGYVVFDLSIEDLGECAPNTANSEVWVRINETPFLSNFYIETGEIDPSTGNIIPGQYVNVPISNDPANPPVIGGATGRAMGDVSTENYDYYRAELWKIDPSLGPLHVNPIQAVNISSSAINLTAIYRKCFVYLQHGKNRFSQIIGSRKAIVLQTSNQIDKIREKERRGV